MLPAFASGQVECTTITDLRVYWQERQLEWVLREYGSSPTVPTQTLLQVLQSELLVRIFQKCCSSAISGLLQACFPGGSSCSCKSGCLSAVQLARKHVCALDTHCVLQTVDQLDAQYAAAWPTQPPVPTPSEHPLQAVSDDTMTEQQQPARGPRFQSPGKPASTPFSSWR